MSFVLGLAQCGCPSDGDVVAQVARIAKEASRKGVGLLVFPEGLMCPRELLTPELHELAEPLDGAFVEAMRTTARQERLWMVFTFYETAALGDPPYNTAVVVDGEGAICGTYRKTHLYDAHGVRESERTQAGDALFAPIDTPFGRVGLAICYDLRFCEVSRAAMLGGCELLLYPSAWYDGPEKAEHWKTLLRARAIENQLFVAGVCKAGERYVGTSLVSDPLGRVVAQAIGKSEELVVCDVDLDLVAVTRDAMPLASHRRPELYPERRQR